VQGIQQKINFYKEGIQKLKAQMEGFYNLKKYIQYNTYKSLLYY